MEDYRDAPDMRMVVTGRNVSSQPEKLPESVSKRGEGTAIGEGHLRHQSTDYILSQRLQVANVTSF